MRILVLINDDEGLYKFRNELLLELHNRHEVYISCPEGQFVKKMVEEGCKFIDTSIDRRGVNPKNDISLYRQYKRILKSLRPDYVITYTIKPNVYGGYACSKLGIPYAVNITGLGTAFQKDDLLKKIVISLYKKGLKNAQVVFFENQGNQQIFIDESIVSKEKTCLLNGAGVNTEHYKLLPYPDDNETRFIFIGRIMKEKGIDELIEAMKKLVKDGEKVKLDVLGPFEEDYRVVFEQCINEGWLNFYGEQFNILPYVEQSHCFVLPSWHEGMANTNLESASMGRPIITSNIHGCKEAVDDGVSGFLCEPQNPESLYYVMKEFINLPYDKRKAMGIAGRKRMEAHFSKSKVVEKTMYYLFKEK